jgi:long-chain acyl-CoA synthetase
VAVVVLAPGTEPTADVGARLAAALDGQVAPYKRLRAVHVVDSLPVSAAGKVLKRDLRAALTGGSADLGAPLWSRERSAST